MWVRWAYSPFFPPPWARPVKEMSQFYSWAQYTKCRILQNGHPWGRHTNCRIFIAFYKMGIPEAVTQTVEFLSHFTKWATLGLSHKLSNFYRILQNGHPWGRYTNCRIFIAFYKMGTPGAVTQIVQFLQLGPLHIPHQFTGRSVIQTVADHN